MTTELVLLLSMFVFLVLGSFIGENGPRNTFKQSGPRLGARIERDISTGEGFNGKGGKANEWRVPIEKTDTGELK
jgi:hypothetical protein